VAESLMDIYDGKVTLGNLRKLKKCCPKILDNPAFVSGLGNEIVIWLDHVTEDEEIPFLKICFMCYPSYLVMFTLEAGGRARVKISRRKYVNDSTVFCRRI